MKQFSLDEFKKNPSRKIVTRDGRTVRIICTDFQSDKPIIGLVKDKEENKERAYNFSEDGKQSSTEDVVESNLDLFFVPIKKEGWVNIYSEQEYRHPGENIFKTKEEAIKYKDINYIATIKIEWEE